MDYHKISLNKIAKQLDVPDGYIRLSGAIERDSIVNGDGLRAVLWVQGCPNHCPGCQNPETWDYEAGRLVKIEDVLKELTDLDVSTMTPIEAMNTLYRLQSRLKNRWRSS